MDVTAGGPDWANGLPAVALRRVFQLLVEGAPGVRSSSYRDVVRMSGVCRRWNELSRNNHLWKYIFFSLSVPVMPLTGVPCVYPRADAVREDLRRWSCLHVRFQSRCGCWSVDVRPAGDPAAFLRFMTGVYLSVDAVASRRGTPGPAAGELCYELVAGPDRPVCSLGTDHDGTLPQVARRVATKMFGPRGVASWRKPSVVFEATGAGDAGACATARRATADMCLRHFVSPNVMPVPVEAPPAAAASRARGSPAIDVVPIATRAASAADPPPTRCGAPRAWVHQHQQTTELEAVRI